MSKAKPGITLQTVLVPKPNLFLREEDNEGGILFDPDTGAVRVLNRPASETWKLLDGRRDLMQVIKGLRKKFEELDSNAEKQVLELAEELLRLGVVGLPLKDHP